MKINTSPAKQKASRHREASEQPKARDEQHYDRSDDLVTRVQAAKAAAQREIEDLGDPSEYDITSIRGQRKEDPADSTSLDIVNAPRDGRSGSIERIEVITPTCEGEKLARTSNSPAPDQKLYHVLVKPRRRNTTRRSIVPIRRSSRRSKKKAAPTLAYCSMSEPCLCSIRICEFRWCMIRPNVES
jgi:hypothetical protein